MRIDREIDFHGYTVARMRAELEIIWSRREWHGLKRVRIIHGTGAALWKAVRAWSEEKAIPWTIEPSNPGVTILHPSRRALPPPAPPHRPIARLKHVLPPESIENPKSKIENSDELALFEAELERLETEDPRAVRRRKHES